MATKRYSIGTGQDREFIVVATGLATVTKEVEVTIDTAVVTSKDVAIAALRQIIQKITKADWPPA